MKSHKTRKKLVLVGAGGHAKVLAELIARHGVYELVGATDLAPSDKAARRSGLTVLGSDRALDSLRTKGVRHAAVGVGSVRDTAARRRIREMLERRGFELPPLAHPDAVVSASARIGAGCQVMAGAVINADASLQAGCVVNTGAIIEHDCALGKDAFVGPGARLGGGVTVGDGAFIGMGATLLQGLRIGTGAVVGAGAVVLNDVPDGRTAVGVPAKLRPPR